MSCPLATERVWVEKSKYHEAEKAYFERLSKLLKDCSDKENLPEGVDTMQNNTATNQPDSAVSSTASNPNTNRKQQKQKANKANRNRHSPVDGAKAELEVKDTIKQDELAGKAPLSTQENSLATDEQPKAKKSKKKKNKNKEDKSQDVKFVNIEMNDEDRSKSDMEVKKKSRDHLELDKLKTSGSGQCTLVSEIAKARQHIKNSLEKMDGIAALAATPGSDVVERLNALEKDNANLRQLVESLKSCFVTSENRIKSLEARLQGISVSGPAGPAKPAPAKKQEDDEDDGVDLFASESEEEDEAAAKVREQRLAEYNAKKSKKPALIAKSSLVLDIKPWDDETDMTALEAEIRKIATDGLLWGASKLVPVAYGIKKLSITCVVEDDKVSIEWLTEEIEKAEDYVQSVDVAAFNKI